MRRFNNISIKLKTSILTSLYVLMVLIFSLSISVYSFKEKLYQEKINSLKENIINLSESYKDSIITSNLEKIDELVNFMRKIPDVKFVFLYDNDGKVVGGTDLRFLGMENPDFSRINKDLREFDYEIKVDNFTIGKTVVFYDENLLKKDVFNEIKKIITPVVFIAGFIIVASFMGTFIISSVMVSPLITLKENIISLLNNGFNIDDRSLVEFYKDMDCDEGFTKKCWIFSKNPYDELKGLSDKALKSCLNCKIFKDNSTDEIQQLSYSFTLMVASLNDFIKKLEEAHKERETLSCMAAMGEMSARLAHEIKNALYSISNAANYIKQNTQDDTIKDFGRIIKSEANRLNELTISFLNFSKLLEPKFDIKDINQTIIEATELLKYDCEDEDINLMIYLDRNLKPIKHDSNLIKQAIFNLVINSIDAIKQKGTNEIDQILIKTSAIEKDKKYLRIEVEDNGIGIDKENVEKIFKPFFTTKPRGTGLGLSIVYKIVYAHNGSINVESEYGKYTKFTIDLPYKEV